MRPFVQRHFFVNVVRDASYKGLMMGCCKVAGNGTVVPASSTGYGQVTCHAIDSRICRKLLVWAERRRSRARGSVACCTAVLCGKLPRYTSLSRDLPLQFEISRSLLTSVAGPSMLVGFPFWGGELAAAGKKQEQGD